MAITIERQGQRVYLIGDTYPLKDQIKALGGHWDGDRRAWWVGVAKETESRQLIEKQSAPAPGGAPAREDPDKIRLTGKGQYKGRSYFLGIHTRDNQRVRCLTLPDASGNYLDFWADLSQVQITKTYTPREHTYRGRTTTEYTTLGSIARFVERERKNREEGSQVCAECGTSGELVRELEDGLLKHRRCCDMPP